MRDLPRYGGGQSDFLDSTLAYRDNQWIRASRYFRPVVRGYFEEMDLEYVEEKSFFESTFRVKATPMDWYGARRQFSTHGWVLVPREGQARH